ncbi:MAG: zf-HC2 domain-containing protein [Planctomycetota bacterium]|nr:zf-HC2 domain-containing protein [Planctomycetota bacterium]
MNGCDQFLSLFSALIDGELTDEETCATETHLQSCEACRREWQSLQHLDGQLAQHLIVRDVASKADAISRATEIQASRRSLDWNLSSWISLVAAVAAALLLLVLPFLWSDKGRSGTSITTTQVVARLVRSTGPVQVLPPGASHWTEVNADSHNLLFVGSRLRTGKGVVCEFETTAKGTIRVNKSAELMLRDPRQVELVSGQLWCLAPEDDSINLDVAVKKFDPNAFATFRCPSKSEVQCEAVNDGGHYDSVSTANAQTSVTVGDFSCVVCPGEVVTIDSANRVDRADSADSASKIWQLPLLAVGGRADGELVSLLNHVLAPIGSTKIMHLNERQIRQLGPLGSIPLLAYTITETSPEHLKYRHTAIRLASELADQRATPLLESLLSDPDHYVADLARKTLARILKNSDRSHPEKRS